MLKLIIAGLRLFFPSNEELVRLDAQVNRPGGLRAARTSAVRYVGAPQSGQLGLFGGAVG